MSAVLSASSQLAERLPLQTSPVRVSQPDDPLEKEAEAVADRVMRMPSPEIGLIQRCPGGCPDEEMVHRQPADGEEEEELIQRRPGGCPDEEMLRQVDDEEEEEVLAQRSSKSRGEKAAPPEVASAIQAKRGGGNPLPLSTRRFFEPRFGADFSMVRVHHSLEAAHLAASVKARAFTLGRDLFFGSGEWSPGSSEGNRLIAHELAHVGQQRAVPDVIRRTNGQQEAELRADLLGAPEFPGCSPHDRVRLDFQLVRARTMVQIAIRDLNDEMSRIARGSRTVSITSGPLNEHFHTNDPSHIRTIVTRLGRILTRLQRGRRNWRCISDARCRRECPGSHTSACAGPSTPVYVCAEHFTVDDLSGALTLIHEAAHQSGMMGRDVYNHQSAYPRLSTGQSLNNPDSYATFCRDNFVSGATEHDVWTARDMSISPDYINPSLPGYWFVSVGTRNRPPRGARRATDRFTADIMFYVDAIGMERNRPYTRPEVGATSVLSRRRRSARPRRQTLFDETDPHATDAGPGSSLNTSFSRRLDYRFDPADRGALTITARLQDFDTATTLRFRETFLVRPTAGS